MDFYYKDLSYSYVANGTVVEGPKEMKRASSGWKNGDILSLSYSPKIKQLSIAINNKQPHTMKIKDTPNGYRVAIYIFRKGDCAQLMDFTIIDDNDGNAEEK